MAYRTLLSGIVRVKSSPIRRAFYYGRKRGKTAIHTGEIKKWQEDPISLLHYDRTLQWGWKKLWKSEKGMRTQNRKRLNLVSR